MEFTKFVEWDKKNNYQDNFEKLGIVKMATT